MIIPDGTELSSRDDAAQPLSLGMRTLTTWAPEESPGESQIDRAPPPNEPPSLNDSTRTGMTIPVRTESSNLRPPPSP